MSNPDTSALLHTLYSNLAQNIVQQCLDKIQHPDFLSKLDLSTHLTPAIQSALEQVSSSEQTAELAQQISFMEQMIALLQTALEEQGGEIDSLQESNKQFQGNIDRLQNKVKQLEKENAAFRVEISNNRTFILDRLNALQEEIERLQK